MAHSFGTYIIATILKREFDFKAYRVVFCGSVLKYQFPFEQVSGRFSSPILNEVGAKDIWPALAESITWGYGSAGTYGFRRPRVRDRWHLNGHHGYFLTPGFCEQYWIPFFKDGTIVEVLADPEPPSAWIKALSIFRLKYMIIAVLTFVSAETIFLPKKPADSTQHQPADAPASTQEGTSQRWVGKLTFAGPFGEFISGGNTISLLAGTPVVVNEPNPRTLELKFETHDNWELDFAVPEQRLITVGEFDNAVRYPFQRGNEPGLSLSGDGRGCNEINGKFVVTKLERRLDGRLKEFAADFHQRCDNQEPLTGVVTIDGQ